MNERELPRSLKPAPLLSRAPTKVALAVSLDSKCRSTAIFTLATALTCVGLLGENPTPTVAAPAAFVCAREVIATSTSNAASVRIGRSQSPGSLITRKTTAHWPWAC